MYHFSKQLYGNRRTHIHKLSNITTACTMQKTKQGLGRSSMPVRHAQQHNIGKQNQIIEK